MAESINVTDLAVKIPAALTTADQIMVFDQTGDTNRTPLFEAVAKANGENGCLCVRTAKLDIPSAEVLTLNTTPKAFGLTVPAGFIIQPLRVSGNIIFNSSAYATNTRIAVRPVGGSTDILFRSTAGFLAATSDAVGQFEIFAQDYSPSTDFEVFAQVGDPTAGDSDITIYLTYVLVPL